MPQLPCRSSTESTLLPGFPKASIAPSLKVLDNTSCISCRTLPPSLSPSVMNVSWDHFPDKLLVLKSVSQRPASRRKEDTPLEQNTYTDAESSCRLHGSLSYRTSPHLGKSARDGNKGTRVLKILTEWEMMSQ